MSRVPTDSPLPPPHVTPAWAAELEYWAGRCGLPCDPWPARDEGTSR